LFKTFDDAGLCITLSATVNFLSEFSYSNAMEFKEEEKSIITIGSKEPPSLVELMPEKAWNKFWITVDTSKKTMLEEIHRLCAEPNPRFFYYLFRRYTERGLSHGSTFDFVELSPFNWSKVICLGVGGVLSAVNAAVALPTAGIALASVIAGVIASSVAAGF